MGDDSVNFVDPLGLEMQIAGSAAFRTQALADMQKLTRDTLAMRSDGTIIITSVNDTAGTLDAGTELIRRMNTKYSVTGRDKDKHIIAIVETSGGNVIDFTDPTRATDSINGTGAATTMKYNPSSNPSILTIDSVTDQTSDNSRPPEIGFAHEVIHADHAREGDGDGYIDPVTGIPKNDIGLYSYNDPAGALRIEPEEIEELRTVGLGGYQRPGDVTENDVRSDHGLCERAAY